MRPPDVESQLESLAAQYGAPVRVSATLEGRPFDPLDRTDRYGEVCMVIRRPSGRLLTATKTFYPPGCFRLLTGGVSHGEPIAEALLREVDEETGLDIAVRRFLVVIEYHLARPGAPELRFASFVFLLDELGGRLQVRDPEEQHAAFYEALPAELPEFEQRLASLAAGFDPAIGGAWRDWGRFRAVVHRVVHELLEQGPPSNAE
jgi:NAD+ diphosphatase